MQRNSGSDVITSDRDRGRVYMSTPKIEEDVNNAMYLSKEPRCTSQVSRESTQPFEKSIDGSNLKWWTRLVYRHST